MSIQRLFFALLLFILSGLPVFAQSNWHRVNLNWDVSCNVDRGSIERRGADYTFRTSANHCTGGIFAQRAEIFSSTISVNRAVTYLFETTVAMTTQSTEPFVLFQIHDGRNGCAPPLSVRWKSDNTLGFDSDYTRDQGMDGCVENRALRDQRYTGARLQRNGTPHKLQVLLTFDGNGNFDVVVYMDGAGVLQGRYEPSSNPGFVSSSRFYMKHGVYSQRVWSYEMTSTGMRVLEARN